MGHRAAATQAHSIDHAPAPPRRAFHREPTAARFRRKLLLAMMVVVTLVGSVGFYFAQRTLLATALHDAERAFLANLAARQIAQNIRAAALGERVRALARRPRLHAALEDDALDLLYPTARDELSDIRLPRAEAVRRTAAPLALHANFYRFLDAQGAVIPPRAAAEISDAGALDVAEETQLKLAPDTPPRPQLGYLARTREDGARAIDEILALPMFSTATGEVIAWLVLGFPLAPTNTDALHGVWLHDELHLPALDATARSAVAAVWKTDTRNGPLIDGELPARRIAVGAVPHFLFSKRLNADSAYAPAFELSLFSLAPTEARLRWLRWEIAGAGVVLLLGALAASSVLAGRLSRPVEKLAVASEENRVRRHRAEAALETTSEELQRSMRFSADASHQLKTPVTVLRAGLEELLAGEKLTTETREEISTLVHQTLRLTGVIEDLLLLSRLDAGRLRLELASLDLVPLIDGWLDDLGALGDGLALDVQTALPPALRVRGDRRYAPLILQNLLENARKYNRAHGRVRIAARSEGADILLIIGNTGRAISPGVQPHLFERFHRGETGETIPGHGLGLNLARELARLHGGDLRLVSSADDWTEFEVRFRVDNAPA
jgi:signal transduction histidine kinase